MGSPDASTELPVAVRDTRPDTRDARDCLAVIGMPNVLAVIVSFDVRFFERVFLSGVELSIGMIVPERRDSGSTCAPNREREGIV
jgi:hypothetical protein